MINITTRSAKGAALTHEEVDNNFTNLQAAIGASKNDAINGLFRIAQAGTSFTAPANGAYDLDGWQIGYSTTAVVDIAQIASDVPGTFKRRLTVTTADAAIGVAEYFSSIMKMRGYEAVKYIGKTFNISFDVISSVVGIHCLAIYTGTNTYVAEYTINEANVKETKNITIVGGVPEVASSTSGVGFTLLFNHACGTDAHAPASLWSAGYFQSTANQVNDLGTIGNVFSLENVIINLGTAPTPSVKSYEEDLAECKLYYNVVHNASGHFNNVSSAIVTFHTQRMNSTPTMALVSSTLHYSLATMSAVTAVTLLTMDDGAITAFVNMAATTTAGEPCVVFNDGVRTGGFTLSARL